MQTVAAHSPQAITEAYPAPRRWTRQEFARAAEQGLFRPEERLERIRWEIVTKMTQNRPHVIAVGKTEKALEAAFPEGCHVVTQAPIRVGEHSDPEPDVTVVRGAPDDYAEHPTAADILLVVEVSDSTLAYDRADKSALYAEAGIAEYWIVNLRARVLEIYRDPAPDPAAPFGFRYRTQSAHTASETVAPLLAPQPGISVAEMLPLAAPGS